MKTKSPACVSLALALITLSLTGCLSGSSAPKASPQIYQPRVLLLKAGQPVQTREGLYLPQLDETWHSAAAYELLENQVINTAAALAQERNRTR